MIRNEEYAYDGALPAGSCPVKEGVVRKRILGAACLVAAAGVALAVQQPSFAAQSGKLVVIVEENESYSSIVGNSQAPYLNQLIGQGLLFTSYTAVADGSHPNYLAMTSGLTSFGSTPPKNVFQAIDGNGGALSWEEFMESAPGTCADGNSAKIPGTSTALYTADHDPAYAYRANTSCNANDVPMTSSTFNPANLPSLSYIVPNQCDDMHTLPGSGQACPAYYGSNAGSSVIKLGDNWLANVVPQLLAQPGVTVLITWDEWSAGTPRTEHLHDRRDRFGLPAPRRAQGGPRADRTARPVFGGAGRQVRRLHQGAQTAGRIRTDGAGLVAGVDFRRARSAAAGRPCAAG